MPVTDSPPRVSVVVPVFGNGRCLGELAERIAGALAATSYELILVDDASPDAAREHIQRLLATDARVVGLELAKNVGQNTALLAGVARARGELLAVMDGDLQDPPEALPRLIAVLAEREVDVVYAARRGLYEGPLRLLPGRALKLVLWALTGGKVPPTAGLFLVMRRAVAERVLDRAAADPYLLVLVARAARSRAAVPVARARARQSSYGRGMRLHLARRALSAAVRR
jgi:glycosyltransferase involved in cell wall biosynthesis